MWTSAVVTLGLVLAESPSPAPAPAPGMSGGLEFTNLVAPILSTGVVGVILIMILFRIKLMPSYFYDEMIKNKDVEIAAAKTVSDRDIGKLEAEKIELKASLLDAHRVYTEQVIPTLTRVLDAERELVDLRREEAIERRRRGPDG